MSVALTLPSTANSTLLGGPARTETSQTTVPESVAPATGDLVATESVSLLMVVFARAVESLVVVAVLVPPPRDLARPTPSAPRAAGASNPAQAKATERTAERWRRRGIARLSSGPALSP